MNLAPIYDLYSDYLIVNQGQATATSLSDLLENKYSHDKITRALSKELMTSKNLWKVVKPQIKQINNKEGVLILDDTVEEKPHMQQNELVSWHYDHVTGRHIKGINQLTALYHNKHVSLPVGYALIEKDTVVFDKKKNKDKRVASICKHTLFRNLIKNSIANQLKFKYILADKWFASVDNFNFIDSLGQHFIMPLKNNRKVATSKENQQKGSYQSVESLVIEENQTLQVYLEDVEFPLLLTKQLFKNGDAEVVFYLVTNDLTADVTEINTQYQKRWQVETFYKSVKSNFCYANSPTYTLKTQNNHLFLSMVAFAKMEMLKTVQNTNHFAMKRMLNANALKASWKELKKLKEEYKALTISPKYTRMKKSAA